MAHDHRERLTAHLDEARALTADFLSQPAPDGQGTLADAINAARGRKPLIERLAGAELEREDTRSTDGETTDREVSGG